MTTQQQSAFDALKKQLHDDEEMAWAWHCNIAMAVYDTTQPAVDYHNRHRFANEAAARTLSRLFDVDMTKHPHWEDMKAGWAIIDQHRAALRAPEEGEVWLHRKGDRYTVIGTTDAPDAEKADKFPRVVFYRGPDGRKWSRPLLSFLESFTNDFTRNVPECNGSHDDGQIAAGDAECTACAGEQTHPADIGTAHYYPVETQPGSPHFDGAEAYEAHLRATAGAQA
jgi:hypothetical protein